MRILVAPDKFKGSLRAREVAASIAAGLRDVLPDADITLLPVADGGEGTAVVIAHVRGGEWKTCAAHDAIGRRVEARYFRIAGGGPAVMEMSEAAGMSRLRADELDPGRASTFGVGEMLLHALRSGSEEIIIGLGGSATSDGGFGLARALGFRFLDAGAKELGGNVLDLLRLEHICPPAPLNLGRIITAADVRTPLLGPTGATFTFASQKGASAEQLPQLEAALARLTEVVAKDMSRDFASTPGAGAAGGLGYGLMSFAGAEMQSGFDVVADLIGLRDAVERADVVITGEGRLDAQTCEGKAPAGVAQMARSAGRRVFAIVGCSDEASPAPTLFDAVCVLARPPVTPAESVFRAAPLLRERARELALQLG
jgi:glycerate kinase